MIESEIGRLLQRIKRLEKHWTELAEKEARTELEKIWEEWSRLADEVGLHRRSA